jgi:hypothetical protein
MLALLNRVVLDPTIDVERLERILAFQERLLAKQAEFNFLEAKSRIKKKLANIRIVKNRKVLYDIEKNHPEKGQAEAFKYAPLEEIDKHLAPLLAAEDMDLTYTTRPRVAEGGGAVIVGKLRHVQGHCEESEMPLPLDVSGGKSNIQAMGSTNSYGRRYIACNLFNIVVVGDDYDGVGAGTITEEQAAEIIEKIPRAKFGPKFLAYVKAQSIEDSGSLEASVATIPGNQYKKAISTLDEQIKKLGTAP